MILFLINNGKTNIISVSLINCSNMFDIAIGVILCLPKKYPLRRLDIETKGIVRDNDIIKFLADFVFRSTSPINDELSISINIIIMFITNIKGYTDSIMFLPRYFSLLVIMLIARGKPKVVRFTTNT